MLAQYEPNVKATIAYLKLLKVKVNNDTVNETLQNHPDWPSLLCITDSLNKWNVPNAAGKIEQEKLDELPVPFVAYTNNRENPLAIVVEVSGDTVSVLQKNNKRTEVQTKADFQKSWNGVFVIAEPNEHSGEAKYKENKRKLFFQSLIPFAVIVTIVGLSLFSLYQTIGVLSVSTIGTYLQYVILLAGVVVTTLLLWYEIDKSNPLLQKVCTGIAKGNCNAILTGKAAKVFSWLSWSEVGFFYFTGTLLLLVFVAKAITIVAWLNLIVLPYTIFSVYYQWRVAKQWCVLCLAVQAILISGAVNVFGNNLLHSPEFGFSQYMVGLLLISFTAFLWFSVKPYVMQLQEAKNTKREYLRLKFNKEIFNALLKKGKVITQPTNGLGITIGNLDADNILIKVCNPYCGPCAKAHPKIEKLLEEIPNLKAQILFTTPNNPENEAYKPVNHLLAIASENNQIKIQHALDDWYLAENKDYDVFAAKYPMNGELTKQGQKIEAMEKWGKAMDIQFTPTIFINGYQLPDAYSIEDLEYFLLE